MQAPLPTRPAEVLALRVSPSNGNKALSIRSRVFHSKSETFCSNGMRHQPLPGLATTLHRSSHYPTVLGCLGSGAPCPLNNALARSFSASLVAPLSRVQPTPCTVSANICPQTKLSASPPSSLRPCKTRSVGSPNFRYQTNGFRNVRLRFAGTQ